MSPLIASPYLSKNLACKFSDIPNAAPSMISKSLPRASNGSTMGFSTSRAAGDKRPTAAREEMATLSSLFAKVRTVERICEAELLLLISERSPSRDRLESCGSEELRRFLKEKDPRLDFELPWAEGERRSDNLELPKLCRDFPVVGLVEGLPSSLVMPLLTPLGTFDIVSVSWKVLEWLPAESGGESVSCKAIALPQLLPNGRMD